MYCKTIFVTLLLLFCQSTFAKQVPTEQTLLTQLQQINRDMRADYSLAIRQAAKKVTPLIVLSGEELSFYHHGKIIDSKKSTTRKYYLLKNIAHIVLRTYSVLSLNDDIQAEHRNKLLQQLQQLQPSLNAFSAKMRHDQKTIVNATIVLLRNLSDIPKQRQQQMKKYFSTVKPALLRNIDEATKEQLTHYKQIVKPWFKQLNNDEKKQLLVVIGGGMMARQSSADIQFFAKMLHTTVTDKRLLYLDNVFAWEKQIPLIGTYVFDTQIGSDVFADKWRMHRDVRADAAKKYLATVDFK